MANAALAFGVTVALLVAVSYIGIRASRGLIATGEDLVSAPGTTAGPILAASLVSTNLGAWVLFTPAEAGADFGGLPAVIGYAAGTALPLLAFVPLGTRLRNLVPRGHSLAEYVRARYGRRMYACVLAVSVAYMFVFLTVELTGAAAALALIAGVPPWATASAIGLALLVYVGYGGLIASIVTDSLQLLVVLPLLVVGTLAVLFALGGTDAVHGRVVTSHESLLSWNARGVRFGLYVGVAVLAGNLLNQGFWQRVYAAESDRALRRGLSVAALASMPVVFLAGVFGIQAAGYELAEPSGNISFFRLVSVTLPEWAGVFVVAVAVLLVTSTGDSLLNGLASLLRIDIVAVPDGPVSEERLVTGGIVVVAVAIAARQFSEIELFFVVDLLCAALVVPIVAGLYSAKVTERAALFGSLSGMAVGLALDPWLRALAVPKAVGTVLPRPTFLGAFLVALAASAVPVAVSAAVGERVVTLEELHRRIERADDPTRELEP